MRLSSLCVFFIFLFQIHFTVWLYQTLYTFL